MIVDFSFILVAAALVTGVVWGVYAFAIKPRGQVVVAGQVPPAEPVIVEYARSFFPIILIVLVVRSFIFEPFRIPSDSMMPTLLDGDFIFVSKYSYGLKLPVVNTKVVPIGDPQRGDVVVFRLPSDPSINYIKRLVGLPGDRISVRNDQLFINGDRIAIEPDGTYQKEDEYFGAELGLEHLGDVTHNVMYIPGREAADFDGVVPAGHYYFMGDNRDNSRDSRFPEVGFVPEGNLVGKAVRIWLNIKLPSGPVLWSRIGDAIK
ncbi:MAG: signal peptidase I [Steroidobacteraceae bacterium]